MWRAIGALPFLLLASFTEASAEPRVRDDWKYVGHGIDLQARLTYSLQDAPLTSAEKEQIYRVIDDKTVHESYTDDQRNEERAAVLSSRVGFIALAERGSDQMIVRGPMQFCGANGNCSLYIFVHQEKGWHLALTTGGNAFIVENTVNHGFHDIATYWHISAAEEGIAVYRWRDANYERIDCNSVKFSPDFAGKPPIIADCPIRLGNGNLTHTGSRYLQFLRSSDSERPVRHGSHVQERR